MKKKITEITVVPYGEKNVSCEPSCQEIANAIQSNDLESRAFQQDLNELRNEWQQLSKNDFVIYCDLVKRYHTKRIAFFAVNGWSEPIILNIDGCSVKDGLHRLKAAIYKGMGEVEVEITK